MPALFGGSVLRAESLVEMTTPASLSDGTRVEDSGLGVDIFGSPAGRRYGHLAGLGGFASSLLFLPERQIAIVVLSNSDAAAWIIAEDLWAVVAPN